MGGEPRFRTPIQTQGDIRIDRFVEKFTIIIKTVFVLYQQILGKSHAGRKVDVQIIFVLPTKIETVKPRAATLSFHPQIALIRLILRAPQVLKHRLKSNARSYGFLFCDFEPKIETRNGQMWFLQKSPEQWEQVNFSRNFVGNAPPSPARHGKCKRRLTINKFILFQGVSRKTIGWMKHNFSLQATF
jgi:hypothetical protein